jgi:hypothetical protein
MATIKDRHNPSFSLFPVNNNRTAWRKFGLPAILVVPHVRDVSGTPLPNSRVFNTKIYIENVPTIARVAGHDNIGRRYPDREIYSENVDSLELAERFIYLENVTFLRNNIEIDPTKAVEGDLLQFVTRSGVIDTIKYYPDADYYDLSDILIDIETLPPYRYVLIYETEFFVRSTTNDGLNEFLCIDASQTGIGQFRFNINHPGEVINEFYNLTPPPYLTNSIKSLDTTVAFYRPFTDILQDVYDEQILMEKVNWVFDVPAEAIPYLSSLLGWELPYFPQSLDALRRAVLRRTVEFQSLKGSRRAIINVFRLFGFEILISNLWWSSDGERFIRPGEQLPSPYENEEIGILEVCQVDLLFDDYDTIGFGDFSIPLVYRPQQVAGLNFDAVLDGGDVTIEAYRVAKNSDAYLKLKEIAENIQNSPTSYGIDGGCYIDANGFQVHNTISDTLDGLNIKGFSQILLSGKLGQPVQEILIGENPPITSQSINLIRETNKLQLTLNGHIADQNESIFAFAIYNRQDIQVPTVLKDLQSNRFDIQVLTDGLTEFADPIVLDFAIEFLYRLKAFHSLLNVIRLNLDFTESYEVTDWCVGGDTKQRYDIDAGMLQVPPAIIPNIPGEINDCTKLDPTTLGYKLDDILLRNRKLESLPLEFEAYKSLDDRQIIVNAASRLAPLVAAEGRTSCLYTHHGQDVIKIQDRIESKSSEYGPNPNAGTQIVGLNKNTRLSPIDESSGGSFAETGAASSSNSDSSAYGLFTKEFTQTREVLCVEDGSDFCYAGRVQDELLYRPSILENEHWKCRPCSIGVGTGLYYTFPAKTTRNSPGTAKPCPTSSTQKLTYSGNAPSEGIYYYQKGIQADYLLQSYNKPLPYQNQSWMGHLYRGYSTPQNVTLHYWNNSRPVPIDQQHALALQRPSLQIDKPNLHLPGTRFLTMNALENDFANPVYKHRPWDDEYSTICGPSRCANGPSFLNFTLEIDGTTGNEILVYDDVDYIVRGNGLLSDICSMGANTDTAPNDLHYSKWDIIHGIFSQNARQSPYITFDQLFDTGTQQSIGIENIEDRTVLDEIIEDSIFNLDQTRSVDKDSKLIYPYTPQFTSYNDDCLTETFDYIDGYAAYRGYYENQTPDYSNWESVLDGLGMSGLTQAERGVYFTLGSGILIEQGLRLDCGCLVLDCSETNTSGFAESLDTICSTDIYIDQDGCYDFNCDHIEVDRNMVLEEKVGACSTSLDGTIPSMFELI